jgi:cation diffusion facilitator family transporter
MLRSSRWIANRCAPGHDNPANQLARTRLGLIEGWASVVINTLLTVVKGWLGLMTGSMALLADTAHTFADSLTSVVVIVGFRVGQRPGDAQHPFGHGRAEYIAGLVVATLLAVTSFEMGRVAVDRIIEPQQIDAPLWVMGVLAAALLVKLWLGLFSLDLGRLIASGALVADAWHHLSDVVATGLVVVAFFGPRWGLPWLDGAMGVCVSVMIAWAAWESMKSSTGPLLGETAPDEMYRDIARIARQTPGVTGVHDMLVHRYGALNLISLHVEISSEQTPMRMHHIGEHVERELDRRFHGHAMVHVDPVNVDHPQYTRARAAVDEAIRGEECCESFHDLRLVGGDDRFRIVFDISTRVGVAETELDACRQRVEAKVAASFPGIRVIASVEPGWLHDAPATQALSVAAAVAAEPPQAPPGRAGARGE